MPPSSRLTVLTAVRHGGGVRAGAGGSGQRAAALEHARSVGARSDAIPRQSRMRRLLIVAQVALSLGLLATGSQLVGTVRAQAVSAGTPADRLLIARFDLRPFKLSPAETETFYRDCSLGRHGCPARKPPASRGRLRLDVRTRRGSGIDRRLASGRPSG